jgi:hypothetical protein
MGESYPTQLLSLILNTTIHPLYSNPALGQQKPILWILENGQSSMMDTIRIIAALPETAIFSAVVKTVIVISKSVMQTSY